MRSLPERLAHQAARNPGATALVHGARRARYDELHESACRFAAALAGRGVARGERVAILAEHSIEYVVACYGALSAGAVVVALNTAARGHDLAAIVGHCGARVLVAPAPHRELPALAAALDPSVHRIVGGPESGAHGHEGWESLLRSFAPASPVALAPDDAAAIVYTSGTTGAPKGVLLSHRNYHANVDAILAYLQLDATDRALCLLPFYYSYGASVLHTHLSVGGTVVLENSLAFPARVLEHAAAERVTGLPGVPSTFGLLLRRGNLAS